MIVNERSWHYRLNNWWTPGFYPRDLCSYFWRTIGLLAIVTLLIPAAVVLAVPFTLGYLAWSVAGRPGLSGVGRALDKTVDVSVVVGGIASIVGLIVIAVLDPFLALGLVALVVGGLGVVSIPAAIRYWHNRRKRKAHSPSLLGSYIKAKKHRVCPIIETQDSTGETVAVGGRRIETHPTQTR